MRKYANESLLTDACSLKELSEFRVADSVTPSNASFIEDVAYRTGLCSRLR